VIPVIHGIREQHMVATPEAHAKKHVEHIAKNRMAGMRIAISESDEPLIASVNHGRWVARCDCGAGVAVDPQWHEARCFGCGTVHTTVRFPETAERVEIERLLMARKKMAHRHWQSSETLHDLHEQNQAHPERLRT
jgi:hypothetical protein